MSSDRNDEFLDNGVSTFTLTDDEGNEYEFELSLIHISEPTRH